MQTKFISALCGMGLLCMAFNPANNLLTNGSLQRPVTKGPSANKIQVAILLDVSNSMDGLIEQAKAQLWNMVSILGKAKGNENYPPVIELALYEYGRSSNNSAEGYVKKITDFTTDLDLVSKSLFALTTNGGDEYCGHVIYSSMNELGWDASNNNYKVVFIAGNEDFLQGDIPFTKACARAKEKGVIINTIYCGNKEAGIAEHWNLGSECGIGSFSCINMDAKEEEIPTPYDSVLFVLNNKLNATYIGYGGAGFANVSRQAEVDNMNMTVARGVAAKRVAVKANRAVYNNASWDMVDANVSDSNFVGKLDKKQLPAALKGKSTSQIKEIVQQKTNERNTVQQQIQAVNTQREAYINAEKAKSSASNKKPTLENEVERIIREQAKGFNLKIGN
jgi:hypothetical protein